MQYLTAGKMTGGDRAWHLETAPVAGSDDFVLPGQELSYLGEAKAAGVNPRERSSCN